MTALAKIVAMGELRERNCIKIVGKCEKAGKRFTVWRLLARGALETNDEQIFERENWLLVEELVEAANKGNEDLIHSASFI